MSYCHSDSGSADTTLRTKCNRRQEEKPFVRKLLIGNEFKYIQNRNACFSDIYGAICMQQRSEVTVIARVFPLCCEIFCDNRHVMNLTECPIIQLRHFRHCVMQRFCSRKIFWMLGASLILIFKYFETLFEHVFNWKFNIKLYLRKSLFSNKCWLLILSPSPSSLLMIFLSPLVRNYLREALEN